MIFWLIRWFIWAVRETAQAPIGPYLTRLPEPEETVCHMDEHRERLARARGVPLVEVVEGRVPLGDLGEQLFRDMTASGVPVDKALRDIEAIRDVRWENLTPAERDAIERSWSFQRQWMAEQRRRNT